MADPQNVSLSRVDRVGATCSTLCAVHCAATAAIPGALAAMGLDALTGHEFEWGFTIVAILFATMALVLGWRRHRRLWIGVVFGVGIAGLLLFHPSTLVAESSTLARRLLIIFLEV